MSRWAICITVAAAGMLAGSTRPATAMVIECGFNDQSGIHGDATTDSPYKLGETINGRAADEPGWNGNTWSVIQDGVSVVPQLGTVVTDDPWEGDGCLQAVRGGTETWVTRALGTQFSGTLLVEQYVRLPEDAVFQSRPGNGGTPGQIAAHWKVAGGKFYVYDSIGPGAGDFGNGPQQQASCRWHPLIRGAGLNSRLRRACRGDANWLARPRPPRVRWRRGTVKPSATGVVP